MANVNVLLKFAGGKRRFCLTECQMKTPSSSYPGPIQDVLVFVMEEEPTTGACAVRV